MNIIQVRSIAAIYIFTLLTGCVGYSGPYGHSVTMGNGYGYGVRQVPYGNYGYNNYQPYRGHDEYRERGEYREREYGGEGRGYGQYRRHDND